MYSGKTYMSKKLYSTPIIILRKKIEGENSIEEIAYRISRRLSIPVLECPCHSSSLSDLLSNIKFVKDIKAPVYHIISPAEAYLLPFLNSGKKIFTHHDLGTNNSKKKLYECIKFIFAIWFPRLFADEVTFVSEETKNESKSLGLRKNPEKMHVIYNSYDTRLIPIEKKRNNSKKIILHIGTAERKNLLGMLNACKDLNVKLLIIGKLHDEQIKCIKNNHIDYENYFDCSFEEIVKFYNECDIVSFPTFYEGFGLPAIEANAMHKPVIVGDIPIMHEVCKDSGYYVNPNDINEIRSAVEKLISDSNLYNLYVEKGIKNAKRFEENIIISQYQELYYS